MSEDEDRGCESDDPDGQYDQDRLEDGGAAPLASRLGGRVAFEAAGGEL